MHAWEHDHDGNLNTQETLIPEAPEENYHTQVQCVACGQWSGCINCQPETLETECSGGIPK